MKTQKFQFRCGDRVMWHDPGYTDLRRTKDRRAIYDCINKNGDALILVNPDDLDKQKAFRDWWITDVKLSELSGGWN